MISSQTFIDDLRAAGFGFFTGVPCSLLSGLFAVLEKHPEIPFVPAVREDAAVGLCAGVYMAGTLPVLLMQNSGLGYCLNAFTSLNLIYKLPVLTIVSWRGFGGKDAPEHLIMGDISEKLLQTAGMDYAILTENNAREVPQAAVRKIKTDELPFTLLVKKGLFDERH
jgi:sulfopyruvate decarboxylase alpha subunit